MDQARKHVKITMAHVYELADAKMIVDEGVNVLAHNVRDQEMDDDFIATFKRRNVSVISTLMREEAMFVYGAAPAWIDDPFFRKGLSAERLAILKTSKREEQAADPALAFNQRAFEIDKINWLTGNGDGVIQKYSHDGKLLLQIGKRGVFDTADGTAKGKRLNSGQTQFFNPAAVVVDPLNGDVYVADGYGNRRVAVFDRNGKFLRQWGRQATQEETRSGAPAVFSQVVYCIAMSNAGLLYVCDRQGDRVQVFDKMGNFQKNIWIRTGTKELPDPRGSAWWIDFSRDTAQKFMYVMNGRNEQVHILDHASGTILASFGRPGHQLGNFTHGHTLAVDSKGNVYVAETDWGRRIQKFRIVQEQ